MNNFHLKIKTIKFCFLVLIPEKCGIQMLQIVGLNSRNTFCYPDFDSILPMKERKKWSRNASTVEPFLCPQDGPHLVTVLVPLYN